MPESDGVSFRTFADLYDSDPPASVLTTAQREYLLGQRALEGGGERAVKRRIRQRIEYALVDLLLLADVCPDKELEKVRPDTGERTLPTQALAAFLYRMQPENAGIAEDFIESQTPSDRDRRAAWVESDVSRGIESMIQKWEGVDADVETSITVERGEDLETLADRNLSELSRDQLDTLLYTGEIGTKEYGEAIKDQLT
jgi:hypothetical protein